MLKELSQRDAAEIGQELYAEEGRVLPNESGQPNRAGGAELGNPRYCVWGASGRASTSRFWRCCLLLLLLAQCTPLWLFRYLPSTDGPSHLQNAAVLANYAGIYREYYTVTLLQPAGNMLTQIFLAALLKVAAPLIAEKLLLTCYVILFFASFCYFIRALTPYPDHFSCFAGILVSNFFLYMGFWNFIYSLCLALFTLGYYVRHRRRWTPLSLAVLLLAGFVIYMTHALSWAVCIVAVAILGVPAMSWHQGYPGLSQLRTVRKALAEWAKPVCCLLPPAIFMFAYWGRELKRSGDIAGSFSLGQRSLENLALVQRCIHRLAPLYCLSFLCSFTDSERVLAKVTACTLLVIILSVVGLAYQRRQYNHWSTSILLTSLVCAVTGIAGPDAVGTASWIRLRVAFYALVFLVAWLAAGFRSWSPLALGTAATLFSCLAAMGVAIRLPELSKWNERLSAFDAIGQHVRSGSTVLQLNLDYPPPVTPENPHGVSPYLHCAGLLSAGKAIVDLRNYEASQTYFTTKFRPEVSPFPALGTLVQLESAPPVFDIRRYETQTRGRVDYLLFQGGVASDGKGVHGLEDHLYHDQIAGYYLVASADRGNLRLYERVVRPQFMP